MDIHENQYAPQLPARPKPGQVEFDGEFISIVKLCENVAEACELLNEEVKHDYSIIEKYTTAKVRGIQIVFACWIITLEGFRKGEWQYFAANYFNPTLTPIKGTAAEILKQMTHAD